MMTKLAYDAHDLRRELSVGRTMAYEILATLPTVRIGRRRLVRADVLDQYLADRTESPAEKQ